MKERDEPNTKRSSMTATTKALLPLTRDYHLYAHSQDQLWWQLHKLWRTLWLSRPRKPSVVEWQTLLVHHAHITRTTVTEFCFVPSHSMVPNRLWNQARSDHALSTFHLIWNWRDTPASVKSTTLRDLALLAPHVYRCLHDSWRLLWTCNKLIWPQ